MNGLVNQTPVATNFTAGSTGRGSGNCGFALWRVGVPHIDVKWGTAVGGAADPALANAAALHHVAVGIIKKGPDDSKPLPSP